jgi:tetratricopeptide (TPR) repeat protein
MFSSHISRIVTFSLAAILTLSSAYAVEESIDSLLKKLPPPEKLVKPRVQQALEDPAFKDPLAKRVFAAADGATALKLGRELAQKDPKSAFAHLLHGATAMDMRQWPEAEQALRNSIALQANHGIVHLVLGVVEMVQHRYAAALPSLQEASRLEPSWATGWMLSSQCAAELGHREESLTFARRATSIEPDWVYTWLQLARAEKLVGHPEGTLNAIVHAAALIPNSADLSAVVGFSYINLNRISQAIPPLERAARLNPDDYLVQGQLGYCLVMVGQVDSAVSHLRKATSLNPSYGPGWEQLGFAYQKKGRHQDAVNAYEKATQIMPGSRLSWQRLAEEYRALGRAADAERAASHAGFVKTAPRAPKKKQ